MECSVLAVDAVATGRMISQARKRAGLSVHDLQMVLGLEAPNAIYRWQRGETLPKLDHLIILASILDVPLDELVVVKGDSKNDR